MNIVILGLPGTGKTSLCRKLCATYGLTYVSDYEILSNYGIKFENSLEIIDRDYSNIILSTFSALNQKNCIFDLNYCILPENLLKMQNYSDTLIFYLGFCDVNRDELLKKFEDKYKDVEKEKIAQIVDLFLEVSQKYKILCDSCNIDFISINTNKDEILKKLQSEVSAIIENE